MKKINIKGLIISIAIPLIIGAISSLISMPFMDYGELIMPPLAPPSWLFPVIWTILYVLMGVSYGILEINSLVDSSINSIYYAQLFVNALWSFFFFVFEWRLFAFLWILLLLALVIVMIIRFYEKNKVAGLLQLPYLVWVTFASYLNLAIYLLNR